MWLTDRDIPFEQKNIRVDAEAADALIAMGASGTPVIVVDGTPLFGFVEADLKAALA